MKTIDEIYTEYNIDRNHLKRDYINNPIKTVPRNNYGGTMKELPEWDDAYYLYIECNIQRKDLSIVFDRSESNLIKVLREMGIKKDPKKVKENLAKNLMKTEGITNVFQRENVKQKVKQTFKEKYGVDSYTQTDEYKIKVKNTKFIKYGNENYNNSTKSVDSFRQHFYNDYQMELLENESKLLEYIIENKVLNIKDLSQRLNIRYNTIWKIVNKNNWYHLFDYSKSILEKEVREFVNQYYHTENNIKIDDTNLEIDMYIPELKVGIEVNGNYYHNEYGKERLYHQNKSLLAETKGIFIYHIFEYEWNNKREQIINQMKNILLVNNDKIFARKCLVKKVNNKDCKIFLENNHLQGSDSSSVKLGLYYNNELVSVMTFVKPRFNKEYDWELSRFCSKANCNVIGGASKLFNYFVNNYQPSSIISYSNIAHTRGKIYEKLGFNIDKISEPNYIWYNHGVIKSRYVCQKHKLIEQGLIGNSETEIMHNNGYYRIYDCGNKVWIWKQ